MKPLPIHSGGAPAVDYADAIPANGDSPAITGVDLATTPDVLEIRVKVPKYEFLTAPDQEEVARRVAGRLAKAGIPVSFLEGGFKEHPWGRRLEVWCGALYAQVDYTRNSTEFIWRSSEGG